MSLRGPILSLFLLYSINNQVSAASNFTATFFFGDSTLDTGNNNFIPTPFSGNHAPYGLSFPGQTPTGRFSDGLLVPDLLTSSLGIKPLSPPYLDPTLSDEDIRTGVNFASAGSGYDDLTSTVSNSVPMSEQLRMFGEYLGRLEEVAGAEERRRVVEGALVLFGAGGNDVIFNFYDLPRRRAEFFDMAGYQDFLHGILVNSVQNVYNHGARKFIVSGLPPIGCLPLQITANPDSALHHRRCVGPQTSDTIAYNSKLRKLLPKLQRSLPGSKIAYLDISDNIIEIIKNPRKYGYKETRKGCCGTGLIEVGPLCNKFTPICEDMSSFLFFDAIHPSERIYKFVTEHIMKNVIPQMY